jgi:hypothetical protein
MGWTTQDKADRTMRTHQQLERGRRGQDLESKINEEAEKSKKFIVGISLGMTKLVTDTPNFGQYRQP